METVYDWASVLIFAGLVVLMLHRSSMETPPDSLWAYLPPAIGCAVANQFGNDGNDALAIILLASVIIYIFLILKVRIRW
ncbi:MAG: XrtV sorting system accessory protein [Sphingobium sp.]